MRISDWSSDVCSSDLFGKGAQGLASLIEDILKKQGEPNAYIVGREAGGALVIGVRRSEEHTSELQSLMRISYAVFCLKKKKTTIKSGSITTLVCKPILHYCN